MKWLVSIGLLFVFAGPLKCLKPKILPGRAELLFKWKYADYSDAPEKGGEVFSRPSGDIKESNIIYGVDYDVVHKVLYAAVPRNAPGVPATLLFLDNVTENHDKSPPFSPFPHYPLNELKACDFKFPKLRKRPSKRPDGDAYHQVDYSHDDRFDTTTVTMDRRSSSSPAHCDSMERLISVYEPVMDICGRLWVVDTGVLEYSSGDLVVKRPQLWTFDVKAGPWNSKLIRRFNFDKNVIKDGTGLTGLTVDILNGNCEETFVYIPNQVDNRIVVYDYFKDDAWYFEDYSFGGDVAESDFVHDGFASHFTGGITSIALGPVEQAPGHYRTVYYTAAASTGEYFISTRDLRSKRNSPRIRTAELVGYRGKDSQAMTHVFDAQNDVVFFAESQTGRVRCWNINSPLRPGNIGTIFQSPNFVYASRIFLDPFGYLWFMSNRFPLFKGGVYDYAKNNIRLYKIHSSAAIRGTICENKSQLVLTQDNISQFFNLTQVITDDLLK